MTGQVHKEDAGRRKGRLRRRVVYGIYLLLVTLILMELVLRIYNPFHFRLKGDRILLPVNQQETIINRINPKLDPVIINTRNSLGFRGPEVPKDWSHELTVIAIGGSTTECHFLSDWRTWPFLLGTMLGDSVPDCWVNNAGLDGHSTYGHEVLLNDYVKKLRPSVILFLTGINDIETETPSFHDRLNTRNAYPDLLHFLFNNSEVLNVALNISRGGRAQRFNNTTNSVLLLDSSRRLELPEEVMQARLARQPTFLAGYRKRLEGLADTCLTYGILPVFITQPNLFGFGRDSVTGVDLAAYPVDSTDRQINGKLVWEILEEYNDVVRALGREKGLTVIDLARSMPKNSVYFYDMSHFTNAGAAEVAGLVDAGLVPALRRIHPGR